MPLHQQTKAKVGIKDIARELGVSIGTVDRALHSRPGINPETHALVLQTAKKLGYRPNLAARFLKSQTPLRIAVQLPVKTKSFFDSLREGIRGTASLFEPAVQVEFDSYAGLGEGDVPLFRKALESGSNGIIICPGQPEELKPWIRKANKSGIPVVSVATQAPGAGCLTAVSADSFTSGAMVGELLSRFLPCRGKVAVITGCLSTVDHAEKVRGFESSLRDIGSNLSLAALVEAHDDEQEAYRATRDLFGRDNDIKGVYASTSNSLSVVRAIRESGRGGEVTIITTDLFSGLVPLIRSGQIAATMYQRPISQGQIAFQSLYEFLAEGTSPSPQIKLAPLVVMRSNLDLFLERMPPEAELVGERPIGQPAAKS